MIELLLPLQNLNSAHAHFTTDARSVRLVLSNILLPFFYCDI